MLGVRVTVDTVVLLQRNYPGWGYQLSRIVGGCFQLFLFRFPVYILNSCLNCYTELHRSDVPQWDELDGYVCVAWRSADLILSGYGQQSH